MLARVLLVLLAGVPVCRGAKGAANAEYYDADGDVQNADFYDSYNDEIKSPQKMTTVMEPITRLKRRNLNDVRTLNPEEIFDVKGVLNNILQGKKPESVRGRRTARDYSNSYDYLENSVDVGPVVKTDMGLVPQKRQATVEVRMREDGQEYLYDSSSHATEQHGSIVYQPDTSTAGSNDIVAEVKKMTTLGDGDVPSSSVYYWRPTRVAQTWASTEETDVTEDTLMYPLESTTYSNSDMQAEVRKLVQHWTASRTVSPEESTTTSSNSDMQAEVRKLVQHWTASRTVSPEESTTTSSNSDMQAEVRKLVQHWTASRTVSPEESTTTSGNSDMQAEVRKLVQHWTASRTVSTFTASKTPPSSNETDMDPFGDTPKMLRNPTTQDDDMNTTTLLPNTTTTLLPTTASTLLMTTMTTMTTTHRMDINAIMAIISNLTYDYEWNLTEQFNETIIKHGVPTCPWEKWGPGGAWTSTTVTTALPTTDRWNFENASVVSKCFVCGLRTPEIPRKAFCADAFAGDFLPLMPVDPRSRGKIAGFRKYCRYIDTQNYIENPDEPRAIYGRFTGGCAVRWTDTTGVYTQRTCRSKYRPLLGKHFASKRMAKLELALVNVENGCIISPMATLLPVSRGISLYARFHACVCNSNWCNRATIEQASFNTLVTILLAYWLVHYP